MSYAVRPINTPPPGFDPALFARPAAPPPECPGAPACFHRSSRWSCGGAMIHYCALNHGEAPGIVDAEDCIGCPDAEPAP